MLQSIIESQSEKCGQYKIIQQVKDGHNKVERKPIKRVYHHSMKDFSISISIWSS